MWGQWKGCFPSDSEPNGLPSSGGVPMWGQWKCCFSFDSEPNGLPLRSELPADSLDGSVDVSALHNSQVVRVRFQVSATAVWYTL